MLDPAPLFLIFAMTMIYVQPSPSALPRTRVREARSNADTCRISINSHLPSNAPLVIDVNGSSLLYPSEDDVIVIDTGSVFLLYCHSGFSNRMIQPRGIQVTCKRADMVVYAGTTYRLAQLGCIKQPDSAAERTTARCPSGGNHTLILIGYEYIHSAGSEPDGSGNDDGDGHGDEDSVQDSEEDIDESHVLEVEEFKEAVVKQKTEPRECETDDEKHTTNRGNTIVNVGNPDAKVKQVGQEKEVDLVESGNYSNPGKLEIRQTPGTEEYSVVAAGTTVNGTGNERFSNTTNLDLEQKQEQPGTGVERAMPGKAPGNVNEGEDHSKLAQFDEKHRGRVPTGGSQVALNKATVDWNNSGPEEIGDTGGQTWGTRIEIPGGGSVNIVQTKNGGMFGVDTAATNGNGRGIRDGELSSSGDKIIHDNGASGERTGSGASNSDRISIGPSETTRGMESLGQRANADVQFDIIRDKLSANGDEANPTQGMPRSEEVASSRDEGTASNLISCGKSRTEQRTPICGETDSTEGSGSPRLNVIQNVDKGTAKSKQSWRRSRNRGSSIKEAARPEYRRKASSKPEEDSVSDSNSDSDPAFIKLIEVCYDLRRHKAVYAWHEMDKRIRGRQRGVRRPPFKTDILAEENIDVERLYKRSSQLERFTALLGSADLANEYIHQRDDHFLSRGHLSPKADFIFGAEQSATFYYINVAPQWQTFNGGNWVRLEDAVRDLIVRQSDKLQVYTGTHGILSLKDVNGNDVEIYLGEKDGRPIVPVPKYYWKVIYDPDQRRGLAVVGLNNPYLRVSEDDILCENICHAHDWIDWDIRDQEKGFMYCCTLDDFQKKIQNLSLELVP